MKLSETVKRIEWLRNEKCIPYIMRDISCWESEYKDFYTDIAAWCNQIGLFKHMEFDEFLIRRYPKNINRAKRTLDLYLASK
jgi:hypothetical protein